MIKNNLYHGTPSLRRSKKNKGQTLVEYALILSFISVIAISVLITMGTHVKTVYSTVNSQLGIAGNGGPAAAPPRGGG